MNSWSDLKVNTSWRTVAVSRYCPRYVSELLPYSLCDCNSARRGRLRAGRPYPQWRGDPDGGAGADTAWRLASSWGRHEHQRLWSDRCLPWTAQLVPLPSGKQALSYFYRRVTMCSAVSMFFHAGFLRTHREHPCIYTSKQLCLNGVANSVYVITAKPGSSLKFYSVITAV